MNKFIKNDDFLSRFSGSKVTYSGNARNLARKVIRGLYIASIAASVSTSLPAQSVENEISVTPPSLNALNVNSKPESLSFEKFKEISTEKRSGIYEHPYREGETITLFMMGDKSPIENIKADWKRIKGSDLPFETYSSLYEYKENFKHVDSSKDHKSPNKSHYVVNSENEEQNILFMDSTSTSFGHGHSKDLAGEDSDNFFYYVLMHEIGHSLPVQRWDFTDYLLNKFMGSQRSMDEANSDFTGAAMAAKGFLNAGKTVSETLQVLEMIKEARNEHTSIMAHAKAESPYFGQVAIDLVISMLRDNPYLFENITPDDIEKMGNIVHEKIRNHDFRVDYKAQVLPDGKLESLSSDLLDLSLNYSKDPNLFYESINNIRSEVLSNYDLYRESDADLVIDVVRELVKNPDIFRDLNVEQVELFITERSLGKLGDLGVQNLVGNDNAVSFMSNLEDFPDFRNQTLDLFDESNLWKRGEIPTPTLSSINQYPGELETEILEVILENTLNSRVVTWDQGVGKTLEFRAIEHQNIIDMAKKYSFDVNDTPSDARVDLFFKDREKTILTLDLNENCISPEFFHDSISLLSLERIDNIKSLKECGIEQNEGGEPHRLSVYNQHEVVIREIDYMNSYNKSYMVNDEQENDLEINNQKFKM